MVKNASKHISTPSFDLCHTISYKASRGSPTERLENIYLPGIKKGADKLVFDRLMESAQLIELDLGTTRPNTHHPQDPTMGLYTQHNICIRTLAVAILCI